MTFNSQYILARAFYKNEIVAVYTTVQYSTSEIEENIGKIK